MHLISTLAYAEVTGVIARLQRERELPTGLADSARDLVRVGPCRRLALQPGRLAAASMGFAFPN